MPSKIQLDENLWFLYICLQKSDLKAIDFNAVGLATSLKPPAARMRYTRLRRQIESGSLNIPHGPGFSSSPPPAASLATPSQNAPAPPSAKRKRVKKCEEATMTTSMSTAPMVGDEERDKEKGKGRLPDQANIGSGPDNTAEKMITDNEKEARKGSETGVGKIKLEYHSGSETEFHSGSEADDDDSEDEMPLAKLRKRRDLALVPPYATPSTASNASPTHAPASGVCVPVYSTSAAPRDASLGRGSTSGNASRGDTPRYVPPGFNTLAVGSRAGIAAGGEFGGRVARGGAEFGNGHGRHGRGVYASPCAGWIDGRGLEDRMGNPGPGWDHYASYQGLQQQQQQQQRRQYQHQHQRQHQELVRGANAESEVPRKSV